MIGTIFGYLINAFPDNIFHALFTFVVIFMPLFIFPCEQKTNRRSKMRLLGTPEGQRLASAEHCGTPNSLIPTDLAALNTKSSFFETSHLEFKVHFS